MFAEMKNKELEFDENKICAEFEKKKHAIKEKVNRVLNHMRSAR